MRYTETIIGVMWMQDKYLSAYRFIWDDNDAIKSWILTPIENYNTNKYKEMSYYELFNRDIMVLFYETE
jgi:hypothetical protein